MDKEKQMNEESLKDAIAKAAEKCLRAESKPTEKGYMTIGFPYMHSIDYVRSNLMGFLWDTLKAVATSEMAATPEGIKAIAEIADALGNCVK